MNHASKNIELSIFDKGILLSRTMVARSLRSLRGGNFFSGRDLDFTAAESAGRRGLLGPTKQNPRSTSRGLPWGLPSPLVSLGPGNRTRHSKSRSLASMKVIFRSSGFWQKMPCLSEAGDKQSFKLLQVAFSSFASFASFLHDLHNMVQPTATSIEFCRQVVYYSFGAGILMERRR